MEEISLIDLPDEILIIIFYELDSNELNNLCATNTEFRKFCYDRELRLRTLVNTFSKKDNIYRSNKMISALSQKDNPYYLEIVEALLITSKEFFFDNKIDIQGKLMDYAQYAIFNDNIEAFELFLDYEFTHVEELLLTSVNPSISPKLIETLVFYTGSSDLLFKEDDNIIYPLFDALRNFRFDIAKALLTIGKANPNPEIEDVNFFPLVYALHLYKTTSKHLRKTHGSGELLEVISLLLEEGADTKVIDADSTYSEIIASNHIDLVRILSAYILLKDDYVNYANSAAMLSFLVEEMNLDAARYFLNIELANLIEEQYEDQLITLLTLGSTPNYVSVRGNNAIFNALNMMDTYRLELLLAMGGNPNLVVNNMTPLMSIVDIYHMYEDDLISMESMKTMLTILMERGADPNIKIRRVSAVDIAKKKNPKLLELL